ncbi:hypothetical protein WUBG_10182, partial [Wuchereria bancrofti]
TQLRTRARRCVCISIGCGCYQPTGSVYRQPLPSSYRQALPSSYRQPVPSSYRQPVPSSYRQPIYRQQPDTTPCVTNCIQGCMQKQQNTCQQSCQNLCGTQPTYQQPKGYAPASYQHEPMTSDMATGQQSATGPCLHVCMPSCESQCIQRSRTIPEISQQDNPVPVVKSQTPSYYPLQQYEPAMQQYANNDNTICIHLCMPSCERQCIERTISTIPSHPERTEQPNGVYYPKPTPDSSESYQNFIPANQTSIVIRPVANSGTTTICLPICAAPCPTKCTEGQRQSGTEDEYTNGGATQEPMTPTQTDLVPREISISLPQSIQQSPDCMNLCQETCMQQCVEQNQPADQCQSSCSYTCQESCAHSPVNTATISSIQQPQIETEMYETMAPIPDNSMNSPLFKTFLLRSPPYYRQNSVYEPQIINCLSGSARSGQCKCPFGYVVCLSTKSHISQQQCCRRR